MCVCVCSRGKTYIYVPHVFDTNLKKAEKMDTPLPRKTKKNQFVLPRKKVSTCLSFFHNMHIECIFKEIISRFK